MILKRVLELHGDGVLASAGAWRVTVTVVREGSDRGSGNPSRSGTRNPSTGHPITLVGSTLVEDILVSFVVAVFHLPLQGLGDVPTNRTRYGPCRIVALVQLFDHVCILSSRN